MHLTSFLKVSTAVYLSSVMSFKCALLMLL